MSAVRRAYSIDAPDQQRLKVARLEIEALLKKHDLAGVVVLHTPGMAEFFYDIRPSYSVAWIDEAACQLRFRAKREDFDGDAVAMGLAVTATANLFAAFAGELSKASTMFREVARVVDAKVRAEHTAGVFTTDPAEGGLQ